ncbi:GAF and ANTAR domain-containing protein [Salinibacterium sp. TMP30]|uniref:GAF and ANTAR domain-containing protein n=1 Tax=Salinibacterium sp. TMP30 TaxID=3138237 RepID=UPI00313928B2
MSETSREGRISAAFVKLADTLIADYDVVDLLDTLLLECTEILDTDAGGLMLVDAVGSLQVVASTSERADFVELMQLNAGAGPCIQCFTTGKAVVVADIDESGTQWPKFRTAALQRGFRSVLATPMRLRGEVLGTMNLFSTHSGAMNPRDAAVAQALTDVATIGILQERHIRETGIVSQQLQRALNSRILIEQAKGVLSQTASIDMDEAFALLRTYARSRNLSLHAVAEGVTDRSLNIGTNEHPGGVTLIMADSPKAP